MNQDQVKEKLLSLKVPCPDFTLVFSGKASCRVNGLYKPALASIVLHNKNFTNDNALIYTALHEFTHHLAHTRNLVSGRNAHSIAFWALFHSLLKLAIEAGVYVDPYLEDEALKAKREEILELQRQQNELNRKLGQAIAEMETLSQEKGARLEDFLDRHARIPRNHAQNLVKAQHNVALSNVETAGSPSLVEAIVSQGEDMSHAAAMANQGCSIQQIKAVCRQKKVIDPRFDPGEAETDEERLERAKKELSGEYKKKERVERRIDELSREIEALEDPEPRQANDAAPAGTDTAPCAEDPGEALTAGLPKDKAL